jgi:DNA-binding PadR family transcriptional regulator
MHPIRFRQEPLNAAKFHILFALADCEPATALAIEQQIIADTLGGLYIKPTSFYRHLRILVEDALIEPANNRPSTYLQPYRLTDRGKQLLKREVLRYEKIAQEAKLRLEP